MHTAVFSTKPYDRTYLQAANAAAGDPHQFLFIENRLGSETAVLASGCSAICVFVNDVLDDTTLSVLHAGGIRHVALRCAGYNNVDVAAARRLGISVARVPAYSPHAVAEHAVALLLAVNRHVPRAHHRVRDGNFSIDGLMGRDLHGKTIGVIGAGTIGSIFARIMLGFGCTVLVSDVAPVPELEKAGVRPVTLRELLTSSHAISLHCPLTPETRHLLNAGTFALLPSGAIVVNTSRGALINATAAIAAVKSGHLGGLALDVYEEEADLFFEDHSSAIIQDDVLMRLLSFPNVVVTSHQAFFTREAMENIASTTIGNLSAMESGVPCPNAVG